MSFKSTVVGASAVLAAGLALLTSSVSCTATADKPPAGDMSPRARHAVQSEKLRLIMQDLQTLANDRMPQEFDTPERRERLIRNMAVAARELQDTAAQVKDMAPSLNLTDDEQLTFRHLAEKLAAEAELLAIKCEQGPDTEIKPVLNELRDTCAGCHSLFRSGWSAS